MAILQRARAQAVVRSLFAGPNLAEVAAALLIVAGKACCGPGSSECSPDPRNLSLLPSNHLEPVT